jgi:hypothetical protein
LNVQTDSLRKFKRLLVESKLGFKKFFCFFNRSPFLFALLSQALRITLNQRTFCIQGTEIAFQEEFRLSWLGCDTVLRWGGRDDRTPHGGIARLIMKDLEKYVDESEEKYATQIAIDNEKVTTN